MSQFLPSSILPSGTIVIWSGSIATIPSGYHLCDGTNGTPDLRNLFVIGAAVDAAGVPQTTITGANTSTGGSKDSVLIAHDHTIPAALTPEASGGGFVNQVTGTVTGTTGGNIGTNQNLPPYFARAYIMKL
jgi:hypothetical protein